MRGPERSEKIHGGLEEEGLVKGPRTAEDGLLGLTRRRSLETRTSTVSAETGMKVQVST